MLIFDKVRSSESPFVEKIWRSHSEGAGTFISIAQSRCQLVVTRQPGKMTLTVRGPETKATSLVEYPVDGEWVGILCKLGTFLPHLPAGELVDTTITLPEATAHSFWLNGAAWQFPDYENADTFVDRLVREGLLLHEPIVDAALQGHLPDVSLRCVQRRFLRAAGVTHSAARQIERARYATTLLRQGVTLVDTVYLAGYFDQPHLCRSLKHFIGETPARVSDKSGGEQLSFLYKTELFC